MSQYKRFIGTIVDAGIRKHEFMWQSAEIIGMFESYQITIHLISEFYYYIFYA